jgi:uncharacterized protein (DUF169 family)
MESKIQKALKLKFEPVAIIWSDDKPEKAMQFVPNRWGCVMSLFAQVAKGKTAVISKETAGCGGGEVGLGFGNSYHRDYPGGVDCFYRFLSTGNADWETGRQALEAYRKYRGGYGDDNFLKGERYIKSPDLVKRRTDRMPIVDIKQKYVIFKPLKDIDVKTERPEVIVFIANPDQLSALVVLANYGREDGENAIAPFGAGCHTIGILAYREAEREKPRAIIGLTDLSARLQTYRILGRDSFTFAMPYKMYQEIESNVEGSFLERDTWHNLMADQ